MHSYKKLILILLCLLISIPYISSFPVTTEAAIPTTNVNVSIGSVSGTKGQIVNVPVSIKSSSVNVASYGMKINFDKNALEVLDVTSIYGKSFEDSCDQDVKGCFIYNVNQEEGWLKVAWVDSSGGDHPISSPTSLFTLKMKIKSTSSLGVKPVQIDMTGDTLFTNALNESLIVATEDGKVSVIAPVVVEEPLLPSPTDDNETPAEPVKNDSGTKTDVITVPVESGNFGSGTNITQTPITRTTDSNGRVSDKVTVTTDIAKKVVESIKASNQEVARFVLPDTKDEVAEVAFTIPKEATKELGNVAIKLEIYSENVKIKIPNTSIERMEEDIYFHIVPIKVEEQRKEVENRARIEAIVTNIAGDNSVNVVSRPMTIETNLQSRPVTLVLPLRDVILPTDIQEQKAFLADLVIFIEHSDGEKELVKPQVVEYKEGQLGLEFGVNKFSTFTILNMEGWEEYISEQNIPNHTPYIKGYDNNQFRPGASVTRAEMATMLAQNLDVTPSTKSYTDVKSSHWAYNYVMEAKGARIMTGVSDTRFNLNGTVTRAQMASITYRWIQKECEKDASAFDSCSKLSNVPISNYKDVRDNHWAYEAMNFTIAANIMIGSGGNTFKPEQNLTRAEAVKVLNKLFKRHPVIDVTTPTFKDVPTTHWAFGEIEEAAR
ncbi:S-layer homology domain-containing protein [Lysinibacillus sp. BW-2-10]|uniref:S-layer homology domain-containing protein n=1 Tax=Lysinibacillus sp. BW-2-10 TaxID=2590030 RepID=UPI00117BE947|nr:S-layer homology domain-containing protein [Lysinibacillus sp. BW-2-10]TSI07367.1 hypothetical protein FJQ64_08685 [Lysinibacillus sp. BW-2-10]